MFKSLNEIIISGRTVGSGPAVYLASKYNVSSLVLLTPIKSFKHMTSKVVGKFWSFFVSNSFRNIQTA
jgi:hypothetical protein